MPFQNEPKRFMEKDNYFESITVEVTYANASDQAVLTCQVAVNSTVRDAIVASDILKQFPDIDLDQNPVGIFSRKVPLDHIVQQGDRIEIYRPLIITPMDARRLRATKKGWDHV